MSSSSLRAEQQRLEVEARNLASRSVDINAEIIRLERIQANPDISTEEARALIPDIRALREEARQVEVQLRTTNDRVAQIEQALRDNTTPDTSSDSQPSTPSDLIGKDPDAWKEIHPNYEPNDDVRIAKAKAIAAGVGPEDRASPFDPNSRAAAYQSTPLSDNEAELAANTIGLDLGGRREVDGVEIVSSGTVPELAVPPPSSAAEEVQSDQRARDESANTQRPEPEEEFPSESEISRVVEEGQIGTGVTQEEPVIPARSEDSVEEDGVTGVTGRTPDSNESTVSDDTGEQTETTVDSDTAPDVVVENVTIPGSFTQEIRPKPNILSEFYSYSYSISLYLIRPEDYEKMILTGQKNLYNSTLLIQSGGSSTARRNRFFDVDFYINDLDIESYVTGKSTQGAHNATLMRFDIVEPYGISFLDRLRNAVSEFKGSDQNILSQFYLMVIRFYGYDEDGNLVQPESKPEETTDSNAAIEKFIPFVWENIKFTVANRLTVYKCNAVAVGQNVGLGQLNTSIPYNIEISGQTLGEILNGEPIVNAPDDTESEEERDSGNAGTLTQGLIGALNRYARIDAEEKGAIPNEYAVKLDESVGLVSARLAQDTEAYLPTLPNSGRSNQTLAQQTGVDNTRRKHTIVAGQPIVQVLDLLVRSSTYITDQQLVKITDDPTADRVIGAAAGGNKYIQIRAGNQEPVAWYKITTHIQPKEYDQRRQEHAYKITYIISAYQVNDLLSEFFPKPRFRGVHKKYDYWFTGENTEVLNFEQQFNSLFYLKMAPISVLQAAGIEGAKPNAKRTTQDATDQSEVMGSGDSAKPAADAASTLYSPADLAMAELQILGDPGWIQQSELLYNNIEQVNYSPFLPDDSINYDSQEPLFQLTYNLPTDYDVEETGIMPVRKFNQLTETGPGSHSYVYRANTITNNFSNGVFTQRISATLIFDPQTGIPSNTESADRDISNSGGLVGTVESARNTVNSIGNVIGGTTIGNAIGGIGGVISDITSPAIDVVTQAITGGDEDQETDD